MTSDDDVVTLEDIEKAREVIMKSPLNVRKTPLLKNMTSYFPELDPSMNLHLKLESLQTTGENFEIGICNLLAFIYKRDRFCWGCFSVRGVGGYIYNVCVF